VGSAFSYLAATEWGAGDGTFMMYDQYMVMSMLDDAIDGKSATLNHE
jgi:hypothetical protein